MTVPYRASPAAMAVAVVLVVGSAALEPDGAPVVEGTANPTTEGLPGPLPASVIFPRAGCWKVTVEGTEGRVSFLVDVG